MDCIIRVIKGPDTGATLRLQSGVNLIGRSAKAALRLTPQDISWEHASITRNGEDYIIENLSALGTYLDDAKITGPIKLRPRDQLRLSKDTILRFETLGADKGLLTNRRGMTILLVLVLLGIFLAVGWEMMLPEKAPDDWSHAYNTLDSWIAKEVQAHRLPFESEGLYRDAWRLDQVGNYEKSSAIWLRLQMELDHIEDQRQFQADAAEHPSSLQRLLTPTPDSATPTELSDDEMGAAFSQFVKRRLNWSIQQAKNTRPLQ